MQNRTPTKFFGLHSHSGFSTFDGLGYPQEHIDFCVENGLDGWSLTDHGQMNGFAHAFLHAEKLHKAGKHFKFVPGCEMYVHPNLSEWQALYSRSRDGKSIEVELETKLIATVDSSDETTNVETESASLTVENEDETKSSKFFDPLKRRHHLVVLPKNSAGLQKLFHLVSQGYSEGFYRFPRIDYGMLKRAAKGDLLVSTACIGGPVAYSVFQELQKYGFSDLDASLLNNEALAEKVMREVGNTIDQLVDAVGQENMFLELQFNKLSAQHLVNRAIIEFAKKNSMTDRLVVTCDSHYSRPEHWREREIYKKLGWLNHTEINPDSLPKSREELKCELYPKNADQVWETYLQVKNGHEFYDDKIVVEAIERTHHIAHDMIGEIKPDTSMKLPSYVIPEGKTAARALLDACKEGLVKRGLQDKPEYIERLKYELQIIKEKNFNEYFLTMKAIIDLARDHMLVGPGRGSGAGSLVNYVLYITDVDPVEYGLLFERFLSIDRAEYPDIDSDISDRDALIKLMRTRFGRENIVPISNYNTFKLKSLIKDVSRFYGIEFEEVNRALASLERDVAAGAKLDDDADEGFDITLEDALKYSESTRKFLESHEEIMDPLQVLFKQNKALGRHAGGVIVSERIGERMPLIMAKGEPQTPWVEGMNYKHLEEFGWVKFDLLGLGTLRMIERTIELILEKQGNAKPTFHDIRGWFDKNMAPKVIDFNDQKVYDYVYHSGRWAGIFQCTNRGAQQLFMAAKPVNVIDLATLTSIYRPGPLQAKVDKLFIKSKSEPETVQYGHPLIKQVLEETYGCIIFQEQVMELCHVVAGFPKAECNKIRKMMKPVGSGNDNVEKARALKEKFVRGSIANGIDERTADKLYENICYFSGYGFNKSHAVSYAMNSYYCAWLMTYYEQEWLIAYLEATAGSKKAPKAISEVKSLGYKIVPIDINYAKKTWTAVGDHELMPSFLSCKGVGETAIDEILQMRPYSTVESLMWNEDGSWKHSKFNKKAMESLIKIRAFESIGLVGAGKAFSSYKQMHDIMIGAQDQLKKRTKKEPFFGKNRLKELLAESLEVPEWGIQTMMGFDQELLGSFNVEAAIPDRIKTWLRNKEIAPIEECDHQDLYWFMIANAIPKLTKNKKPYLMLECISSSGKVQRMFCWGAPDKLDPFTFAVAEVEPGDFGLSTRWQKLRIINIEK